jgi:uncharacterized membrane protein
MSNTSEYTLEDYVVDLIINRNYGKLDAIRKAYEEYINGRMKLIDPRVPRTFIEYMFRLDYTLWFWFIVFTAITTFIIVYLANILFLESLIIARIVLATLLVLFIHGYSLLKALYPLEEKLSSVEEFVLSIGFSIVLLPLYALILNFTPWGIGVYSLTTTITLSTIILSLIGCFKIYSSLKE